MTTAQQQRQRRATNPPRATHKPPGLLGLYDIAERERVLA